MTCHEHRQHLLPEMRDASTPNSEWLVDLCCASLRRNHVMSTDNWAEWLDTRMSEVVKYCCGDDKWRGRFCQYHNGYEDGLSEAADEIERLREDNKGQEHVIHDMDSEIERLRAEIEAMEPTLQQRWDDSL